MNQRPKIYLAGFDVFLPNAADVFLLLKTYAETLGLQALVPTDCGLRVGPDGTAAEVARKICVKNMDLIRECDAVAANLAPFRGAEPDSGTVFEVGFATALGRPVFGYGVPPVAYATRVEASAVCVRDSSGMLREAANGMLVEDFGLSLNLMLACTASFHPDATDALEAAAAVLLHRDHRKAA